MLWTEVLKILDYPLVVQPEALDELEKDEIVLEALGREYAECYLRAKRGEWQRYHDTVSQWEIDNYLGLY